MIDNKELFSLKGKTALITGSSQGIGLALAKGLFNAGANIILNGRKRDKLDEAAKEFDNRQSLYKLCFDVRNYEEIEKSVNNFENNEAQIDILINNAGIQFRSPLDCLLYTSPSPRDRLLSRMPSSA